MSFNPAVRRSSFFIITTLLISASSSLHAESSVEQRLGRLENLLSSQVLMEQSQRVEQIQQELTSLRGLLENQENQLSLIKQRQRNLYQDIDRRLNDLEIKGGGASSNTASVSVVAVPSASADALASPIAPPSSPVGQPSASAAPLSNDKNGKLAYTQAFNTLKEGRYKQAIDEFKAFQKTYPESAYGANAQYWLGETYSVSRDYKTSLSEFQRVVSDYPRSNKVEGALLKIGFTYYEMRDWVSAKTALELVINKYPGTTVARKAKERLQRMKREGH
jgi:tol-pal system protein YbgF